MTDKARDLIENGTYHAYNRGHNGMILFKDAEDFIFYFKLILKFQIEYRFEVFAVCLMSNHFHMIIKDVGIQLSLIMDSINSVYARYFNEKYNHKGAVFDGKFKSNRVLTEFGLLRLFRYVIRNPVAAGITNSIFEYKWVTTTKEKDMFNIINFEYVNEVFRKVCNAEYLEFLNSDEDDLWLDEIEIHRIEDPDAKKLFTRIVTKLTGLTEFDKNKIDNETQANIVVVANNMGITGIQLSKLTGYSQSKIHRLKNYPR